MGESRNHAVAKRGGAFSLGCWAAGNPGFGERPKIFAVDLRTGKKAFHIGQIQKLNLFNLRLGEPTVGLSGHPAEVKRLVQNRS